MTDTERSNAETVTVELSGSAEDARIVFDALGSCFASDRGADEPPQQLHESRPMVWSGTYDVADSREGDCPEVRLGSAVEADVQGGPWAINRFRTTLDSMFSVRETSASGDQERDLHLRLESR
ncbi:hypothetical protein ACIQVT_25185 [Streptomyces sp. NPDC100445]|uniref:hypothetical protein n=1 Tax=Streptomyces sp. NPDC100445 TaxID=3366102 RepID=UPI00382104D7